MKKMNAYLAAMIAVLTLAGCGNSAKTADNAEPTAMQALLNEAKDDALAGAPEEKPSAEPEAAEEAYFGEAGVEYADDAPLEFSASKRMDGAMGDTDFTAEEPALPDEAKAETETINPTNGEPFILTAGEWNDNDNWGFFANLVHSGTIQFPAYGLDPINRVAVTVTRDGKPAANQTVALAVGDQDANCWTAKTNHDGKAYLFYDAAYAGQSMTIQTAGADAVTFTVPADESGQGGSSVPTLEYTVETDADAVEYTDTEVMFILDTTGSMGDEISYLQKDFSAIAEETADGHMTFSVNFYKDEGDEYVTLCNPFTDDVKEIGKALNREYASGGGDEPEAVAQILTDTITNGDWHENTNKIAFLIFDAPPHSGSVYEEQVNTAIAAAAEKGIHLVPVVASNAARETELFGRAAAIMTGSNYVFLTDDSGIGGSHLEPIIGSYDVELLHDIIVRNIRQIAGNE
ncbi:MAG: VWA domain-containing protein [Oscillospiraceae bacterium]|nr:VWA domain-containing protein [Oscillospiraceae bacterium]